ncbi:MAG: (d)CMP kinase [Oscillospiraceae bacterium]|nr:(d)CMP kinase [Oscillospiraceae bacterium]
MFAIAIDGPAGAGKSTIARRVAADLSIIYVDTGALYRAIGAYAIRNGVDTKCAEKVSALLPEITLELSYSEENGQRIFLNGEDVSSEIRLPEMGMAASNVSSIPQVRAFLLDQQRSMAKRQSVIMDGRDIGTVVLPDAQVKIFLTASPEERARRRWKEFQEKGLSDKYEDILADVIRRDEQDMNRPIAPLKQADDAVLLDSTHLNFAETVEKIKEIIKERI